MIVQRARDATPAKPEILLISLRIATLFERNDRKRTSGEKNGYNCLEEGFEILICLQQVLKNRFFIFNFVFHLRITELTYDPSLHSLPK